MKISEMIEKLQELKDWHGDVECWYAVDDEGNGYSKIHYSPSIYYVNEYGDVMQSGDLVDEDSEDIEDLTPICIVN
jgi:hypothetical protein